VPLNLLTHSLLEAVMVCICVPVNDKKNISQNYGPVHYVGAHPLQRFEPARVKPN